MKEVITLKPPVNKAVVRLLSELLEQAQSGRIQGIAVAGVYNDRWTFNTWATNGQDVCLLAELTILTRDFTDCQIDLRCNPKGE